MTIGPIRRRALAAAVIALIAAAGLRSGLGVIASVLLAALGAVVFVASERKRQAAAARAGLAAIVTSSADAIIAQGLDARITLWNDAAERMFGYRADEAIGRRIGELLLPPERQHEDADTIQRAIELGRVAVFDTQRTHRDGRVLDVSMTAAVIRDDHGAAIGVAKVMRDVTDRRSQERRVLQMSNDLEARVAERTAELEAARRDLQTVLDSVPSVIGYWDRNLRNRIANKAYQSWFNVDPAKLRGTTIPELLGDELFEQNRPHIEAAMAGQPQVFERSLRRPDGTLRHGLFQYMPDIDESGAVRGMYVLAHDISDITESRLELAAALRANQALLGAITAHGPYAVTDADGVILEVNEQFCAIAGCDRDELLGQPHRVLRAEQQPAELWAAMWTVLRGGQAWRGELCQRGRGGHPAWLDCAIVPVIDREGHLARTLWLCHEITARKTAEHLLEEERTRLDNILRGTDAGTWDWDVPSGAVKLNERWAQILGYTLAELDTPTFQRRLALGHADDVAAMTEQLQRHFTGESDLYSVEGRVRHRDGRWVWVLDRGRVSERGADGRPLRMLGTMIDISNLKQAEQALRARERQMRLVVEAFPGRLAYFDRQLRCTFASTGGAPEPRPSGSPGRSMSSAVISIPSAAALEAASSAAYEVALGSADDPHIATVLRGEGQTFERTVSGSDGAERHYLIRYVPDREGDKVRGFISAATDVTELKRAQEVLEEQRADAELASTAKGLFLANMSHEIRTPLNAILGMHHLLAGSDLLPDQRELLGKAQLAGRSLLGIVNNVLDLTKIEAGRLTLDEVVFTPADLLHEIEAVFQAQAAAKRVALHIDGLADLPGQLVGDAVRLRQILTNLVGNAIKFTEDGEVRIRTTAHADASHRVRMRIAVRDTGVGIAADAIPGLFTPFTQAAPSTARRFGGTGLGLSIVRQLAQLMGGEVGVTSKLGAGSEFWAILPFTTPADDRATDGAGPLEVLAVDDDPTALAELTIAARALGWRVSTAASGDAALELLDARARDGAPMPRAALVDSRMPDMDGAQLIAELALRCGRSVVSVLAMTEADRRELADRDGRPATAVQLDKPVDLPGLFNAVNVAMARHHGHTTAVLRGTRFTDPSIRWLVGTQLLVVDDNEVNLEVARRVLEATGARVVTCASGEQALAVLAVKGTAFDAVLMDVQMTGMDGLATTRRLRGELGLTGLPVLALTAGVLVEERQHALAAGMDDFLTKPFDPPMLVRALRGWIESARDVPLSVDRTARPRPRTVSWPWPCVDGIDGAHLAAELELTAEQYLGLLRRMLREFADLAVPVIEPPIDAAGCRALAARAHKLAGGASQVGADGVHRAAGLLEAVLRSGPRAPEIRAALDSLSLALSGFARACTPALAALDRVALDGPVAAEGEALTDPHRQDLVRRLSARELGVLDQIEADAPLLRRVLGTRFAELQRALEDLDFETAVQLLQKAA